MSELRLIPMSAKAPGHDRRETLPVPREWALWDRWISDFQS